MADAHHADRCSAGGEDVDAAAAAGQRGHSNGGAGAGTWDWEIEEVEPEEARQAGGGGGGGDDVYVAVGKGGSSMAALSWALRRLTRPRSFVYLVHVFPVVTSIPTPCVVLLHAPEFPWSLVNIFAPRRLWVWPHRKAATAKFQAADADLVEMIGETNKDTHHALGMMPKSRASPEQIETYLNQERSKRREMLQKFLDQCRKFQVTVDVYLIESDQIANAIIELVPVLHIKQLVLGISKSNVRKLKRGNTIAGQVQKSAPLYCEVKIICDGKEVTTEATTDPTPPLSPSPVDNNSRSNNTTPLSSTPNHDKADANGEEKEGECRERKKITKFLRCFSF